jgi:hypothetical protein
VIYLGCGTVSSVRLRNFPADVSVEMLVERVFVIEKFRLGIKLLFDRIGSGRLQYYNMYRDVVDKHIGDQFGHLNELGSMCIAAALSEILSM